jgi:hypothetical protein
MDWTESQSSNIHSYAYDPATNRLHVRFRNGSRGHYDNVTSTMHQEFHTAKSHGKFLHGRLKGNDKHPWTRAKDRT